MRENSTAEPTRKFAEKNYLFFSIPQTDENYVVIPRHSSEKRRYITIRFMTPDKIASDAVFNYMREQIFICLVCLYLMYITHG